MIKRKVTVDYRICTGISGDVLKTGEVTLTLDEEQIHLSANIIAAVEAFCERYEMEWDARVNPFLKTDHISVSPVQYIPLLAAMKMLNEAEAVLLNGFSFLCPDSCNPADLEELGPDDHVLELKHDSPDGLEYRYGYLRKDNELVGYSDGVLLMQNNDESDTDPDEISLLKKWEPNLEDYLKNG